MVKNTDSCKIDVPHGMTNINVPLQINDSKHQLEIKGKSKQNMDIQLITFDLFVIWLNKSTVDA